MGPSGRTRATRTRTRKSTRKQQGLKRNSTRLEQQQKSTMMKNHDNHEEAVQTATASTSSTTEDDFPKTEGIVFEAIDDDDIENSNINIESNSNSSCSSGCSTPKGQRFRIPEISTCPPAPKKRRLVVDNNNQASSTNTNCSVRRSPIAFFAPPDLELFFHYALRGISV